MLYPVLGVCFGRCLHRRGVIFDVLFSPLFLYSLFMVLVVNQTVAAMSTPAPLCLLYLIVMLVKLHYFYITFLHLHYFLHFFIHYFSFVYRAYPKYIMVVRGYLSFFHVIRYFQRRNLLQFFFLWELSSRD